MIVVKVGGGEGINLEAVCRDTAVLVSQGAQMILVHGGSHATNQVSEALGHPPQFVTSPSGYTSRLTDRRTIEIFEMVYCGQINKGIVERLQQLGVNAIGLSGIDGGLWRGPRKSAIRIVENGRQRILRNNFTGIVEEVNSMLLGTMLDAGYLPVLTPPAISFDGEAINVDGDRAAAATAAAVGAEQFVVLSNVPGVLESFPDESSLIQRIKASELKQVAEEAAQGRMRIKLLAAEEAINKGVSQVVIGDSRRETPIQDALNGTGTIIQ
jgi:acetylglutamate/LysW-gamma-L-alpha-aminoadipate kinase